MRPVVTGGSGNVSTSVTRRGPDARALRAGAAHSQKTCRVVHAGRPHKRGGAAEWNAAAQRDVIAAKTTRLVDRGLAVRGPVVIVWVSVRP